jgi:hypothetical protein
LKGDGYTPAHMQGQLFTQDFLTRGVRETPPYENFSDAALAAFTAALRSIYAGLDVDSTINEAQTEDLVIKRVLFELGWGETSLPQVNLSGRRREDVPDMLLFPDADAKARALPLKDDQRYRHGIVILEAKRWLRALDRGELADRHDPDAPSSQMLRYLSRADVVSDRAVKWGILTNGAVWRLYWQDARSRAEEFFEVDIAAALGLRGMQDDLETMPADHALRMFFLFFHRAAFLPQIWDTPLNRSFHAYALREARLFEEKVSQDLGERVFGEIFPRLADALARGDLAARTQEEGSGSNRRNVFTPEYLEEVREAALVLLYRLLFLFYAEDRNLLPARDPRYAPYSVRRIRERVRDEVEAQKVFSTRIDNIWRELKGVFLLIDEGDDAVGMPAYNGGLFDRARSQLLERTRVPDAVMAHIIDALSRRTEDLLKLWINYRDLSVAHLGGIYERLLDYKLVHESSPADSFSSTAAVDRVVAKPASFARKVSGSYYTHDDLVRLILRESVGLLAQERMDAFLKVVKKLATQDALSHADEEALNAKDPASLILELRICDPAMGSGHFLVALVDDLADRVLEAVTTAAHFVNELPGAALWVENGRPWQSPLLARIAKIRRDIRGTAQQHGWAVTDAQLDDRHIVRRMILKKTIFGVDKNPMAVELAKTALWLHTFTVGAPLSFLDHHLKTGDSLHGEHLRSVQAGLQQLGALLLQSEFDRLAAAEKLIAKVSDLTDADITEALESKHLAEEADEQIAPLTRVLDFWRALRWIVPGWPVERTDRLSRLLRGDDSTQQRTLNGLVALLDPTLNLVGVLSRGRADSTLEFAAEANELIARCRALASREAFFHWWSTFPTVFTGSNPGFDAIIGNPPWDRIKLQEVEWFAERDLTIASQVRAADRKKRIAALREAKSPLWNDYVDAVDRAESNARVLGNGKAGSGDYPLLGGGDVNLYSLFVERSMRLVAPQGVVALLTPSGIAGDKGAADFFRLITSKGRLASLYDFENRKVFFPDVDTRFKFSCIVFGGEKRTFKRSRCAFFLRQVAEIDQPSRVLNLSATDFELANPNTNAAPIFRNSRDAEITLDLYRRHPVLVKHGKWNESTGQEAEQRAWPVKYARMFDMTNDSGLFMKKEELEKDGWARSDLNRWARGKALAVPLYEGKMVQAYDHRAADVVVNAANLKRAAQQEAIPDSEKVRADRYPVPQFWVKDSDVKDIWDGEWCIAYKSVTAPSNMRTMIAAMVPRCGVGNSMAMLLPSEGHEEDYSRWAPLLLAILNSFAFDFALRQKVQGQNLNWFIVEQAVVLSPSVFEQSAGQRSLADLVREAVRKLTFTSNDLAQFASDVVAGSTSPVPWDPVERRQLLVALDALMFHLYGIKPDDVAYILETFPIIKEDEVRAHGSYLLKEEILAAHSAILASGSRAFANLVGAA